MYDAHGLVGEAEAIPDSWIPQRPGDLTADWLSDTLGEAGVLQRARVVQAEVEPCATGQGLASQILRLRLRYDRLESAAPATLIAKLPSPVATNRTTAEMVGAYEREILFYTELADEVEIRTPRHYYSAMDPNPQKDAAEAFERFVKWVPTPLLALLPPALRRLAARSSRRYLLLLEDLAPARVGDQVAGCSPAEATLALRALAETQARLWRSPRLESLPWLASSPAGPRFRQALFPRMRRRFMQLYDEAMDQHSEPLPDSMIACLDWLGKNGLAVHERLRLCPFTLVHGDFRLDNLFFPVERNGASIAAVDWAMVHRGCGVLDLAFLLVSSLEPETAGQVEQDLVIDYHRTLLAGGVEDYDFETCWRDYQLTKLVMIQSIILSVGALEVEEERAAGLGETFIRRLGAILPEGNLDELLSRP